MLQIFIKMLAHLTDFLQIVSLLKFNSETFQRFCLLEANLAELIKKFPAAIVFVSFPLIIEHPVILFSVDIGTFAILEEEKKSRFLFEIIKRPNERVSFYEDYKIVDAITISVTLTIAAITMLRDLRVRFGERQFTPK